jgi:LysR family transcriptional regulator, benzoate and cis,cis-muconate-responsive activator of ben and cat genes
MIEIWSRRAQRPLGSEFRDVERSVELRQLRYFVAVAEELHFGRAAARLHMSQSPLSRAIRDLERDLGFVLFVRTTRQVELTPAGVVLLERSRRALAEIDGAIEDARRLVLSDDGVLGLGYGPFSRPVAAAIAAEFARGDGGWSVRFDEGVTPEMLPRVGRHELAAAVVTESPSAARHERVRIDTLRDEPLLAALPRSHAYAGAERIPLGAFLAEVVMLPSEPQGRAFNAWLGTAVRAAGFELGRTVKLLSAPWDRRMMPVASGEAVSVFVAEWAGQAPGVSAVPFDPPLSVPMDLASCWPPDERVSALVEAALRARDAQGWLTQRKARTVLPED